MSPWAAPETGRALARGWALLQAGAWGGAEQAFRQALAGDPQGEEARSGLAAALSGKGEHAEALELLKGLRAERPDDPAIHRRMVPVYLSLRRSGPALAAAAAAVELDPATGESHTLQGLALYCIGARTDAEAALGRAIALDGADEEALGLLAQLLVERGALAEAAPIVEAAAAIAPAAPQVLIAQAELAFARGDLAAAQDFALWGLSTHPDNSALRGLLARLEARRRPWAAHALAVHAWRDRLSSDGQFVLLVGAAAVSLGLPFLGLPLGAAAAVGLTGLWCGYLVYVAWVAPALIARRLKAGARAVRLEKGF